jgi:hypothetical protein
MKRDLLAILILLPSAAPLPANAQQITPNVDRLYVLDCGHGTALNQRRFSPGYNDRLTSFVTRKAIFLGRRVFLTNFCTYQAACRATGGRRPGSLRAHFSIAESQRRRG